MSREEANELFENHDIGSPGEDLLELLPNELVVVTGDLGIGKSLTAERILQKAIKAAGKDNTAPIPVFMKASEAVDLQFKKFQEKVAQYGDVRNRGVSFVIDGADEIAPSDALRVLENARIINERWANSTGVITSRKLSVFQDLPEEYQIPEMSVQDAFNLVSKVAGHAVQSYGFDQSIVDSCKRPLFAILLGIFRRRNDGIPKSTSQLLRFLVDKSLNYDRLASEDALSEVSKIAIDCTNHSTLTAQKIDSNAKLEPLIVSGILTKKRSSIAFSLPVFCEWFAALAIVREAVSVSELISSPNKLDRWKSALIIFAGVNSHETVMRILGPIAEYSPGFVASIVDNAIEQWGDKRNRELPPLNDCGKQIREVMTHYINGLGPLAKSIAPIDEDGCLYQIGVRHEGTQLLVGWSRTKTDSEVIEMDSTDKTYNSSSYEWPDLRWATPASESAWAWRWAQDLLITRLSQMVEKHSLPLRKGMINKEQAWQEALKLVDESPRHTKPIATNVVLNHIKKHDDYLKNERALMRMPGEVGNVTVIIQPFVNIEVLRLFLQSHESDVILPVHPQPDIVSNSGWIWQGYSKVQLVNLISSVVGGAMDEYQQLCSSDLGNLKRHMNLANILPARFICEIFYPKNNAEMFGFQPWMSYYFEPLPQGSDNLVSIDFRDSPTKSLRADWNECSRMLKSYRKDMSDFLNPSYVETAIDFFQLDPVEKLVYSWLEDDLRKISFFR